MNLKKFGKSILCRICREPNIQNSEGTNFRCAQLDPNYSSEYCLDGLIKVRILLSKLLLKFYICRFKEFDLFQFRFPMNTWKAWQYILRLQLLLKWLFLKDQVSPTLTS